MTTREAAVAGLFYAKAPEQLHSDVSHLLDAAGTPGGVRPRALILPHAGYVYSGATAAAGYRQLLPYAREYRQVVLLGPAHRVYLAGMAVPEADSFSTPLGEVPLADALLARALQHPAVIRSGEAHRQEHSLEVHLPFLQTVLEDFTLLPLLVGHCAPREVAAVLDSLALGPEALVVISTDLSHFHDYANACERDRRTCARILDGVTDLQGEEACGAAPLNGFFASELGASLERDLLACCNSGDTAGDRARVVGYAAFCLH